MTLKQAMARARRKCQRRRLANERGWAMFGRLVNAAIHRDPDSIQRKLARWSNRYFRLANGANPWKPYRGY